MSKKTKNNILFAVEQSVAAVLLIVFIVLNFFEISDKAANIVYIAVIVLFFGWLFVYEKFFPVFDNAVHNKMSEKHYTPTARGKKDVKYKRKGLLGVILLWIFYLAVVGALKFTGLLSWQIFLIGACIMFMMNSYFVRKRCYLSVWFLHNKNDCCKNCTINNWDYAIFASALFFAPRLSVAATVLNIIIIVYAAVKLIIWEYTLRKYPYRFFPETNAELSCKNCLKQCKFKDK